MGSVGDRASRSPALRFSVLSERERQVAGCVAKGLTNKGIAEALQITEKTVERHLTKTFRKLGLKSRAQLLLLMLREE